jgi:hypothetical protein
MIVSKATEPETAIRPTGDEHNGRRKAVEFIVRVRIDPMVWTGQQAARRVLTGLAVLAVTVVAACGGGDAPASGDAEALQVSPQNSTLLRGFNRISVALLDDQQNPVSVTAVSVQVVDPNGTVVSSEPLQGIGPQYGGIPVYVGVVSFPDIGEYEYLVSATSQQGAHVTGHAYVTVQEKGTQVAIGAHVPANVNQAILGDRGVTVSMVDSGVPPDSWHTETVAQGVQQHRPMVLFFGDPGYCPSRTCGPTRDILEQLCSQFCGRMLFEHIETYYPAGPPSTSKVNPAFTAFGLTTDPWVYFVNANGIVADRYEGPVTLSELQQSAEGTLGGHVPAVQLEAG